MLQQVKPMDALQAVGADGFNGWTSGLKRSRDPKALKRMYKADTLKQLEALDEAELEVPGGLEIEEIAPRDDLNGADDGGDGSDDDDSDDGGVSLALAIASKRVDRKKQQRAWRRRTSCLSASSVSRNRSFVRCSPSFAGWQRSSSRCTARQSGQQAAERRRWRSSSWGLRRRMDWQVYSRRSFSSTAIRTSL